MAGVGKTTFGRHLAQDSHYQFIDIDSLITHSINCSIQHYIQTYSESKFLSLEESIILNLKLPKRCVVATRGSLIYCEKAMTYLKKNTTIIFITDTIENIKRKIDNYNSRGIVTKNHKTFESLCISRQPLYKKYQDITIQLPKNITLKNALENI